MAYYLKVKCFHSDNHISLLFFSVQLNSAARMALLHANKKIGLVLFTQSSQRKKKKSTDVYPMILKGEHHNTKTGLETKVEHHV